MATTHSLFSLSLSLYTYYLGIQFCAIWPGHRQRITYADGDLAIKDFATQDVKDFKSGFNFATCSGFTISMEASEQHSYIAFGSSAGYVRTFNSLAKKIKGKVSKKKKEKLYIIAA